MMCLIKSVDSKDIQGKQNKHNSKIRKSRDMNGNIKNCNWWGWAGEIAFCVHECIPWGMLQAGLLGGLHRFLCSGKAPSSGGLKAIFSNEWGYELISLTKLI